MKSFFYQTKHLAMVAALFLSAISVSAQSAFKVTGTVTDQEGEALIGVSVKAANGKASAITDIDGHYVITLSAPTTLTYEYIGMESQTYNAKGAATHDVVLVSANTALDDVVVVGYGTQKKINLTGSVQSVSSEEILKRNVSNGSSALQGIVPGLTAIQSSGGPGADNASIRIRGIGSINSDSTPLILIDGVEGDLNRIDLNQIESISVLKDGASAAIYGSRASNGVILVTTKRGEEGKPKVIFNGYIGWNKPTTMPDPVDAVTYLRAIDQARINNNSDPIYDELIEQYLTEGPNDMDRFDTNWRDLLMKKSAMAQNYSVSVSGGNKLARIYASAGYYKQDGMVNNNNFSRTSLRLNSDLTVTKWLDFGADISIRQSDVLSPIGGANSIIEYAMTFTPIKGAINADGTWAPGNDGINPIAIVNAGGNSQSTAPEYSARLSATIRPFKGMTILGQYHWKRNDGRTKTFANNYEMYDNGVFKGIFPQTQKASQEERSSATYKQFNVTATYENTFAEKHYVKAMLGLQTEEYQSTNLTARRSGYYFDGYQDILHGDAATATNNSYSLEWGRIGYVARLNYIYDNRYLVEFSARYDGTSRFTKEQRWGFYPSVSAGWRISEENFWESVRPVVNNLKLRLSYGQLGNESINSWFPYIVAVSSGYGYGYWFDKVFNTGAAQVQLANPELHWEKSVQRNIGLDFGLFNDRLTGSFDFYYRYISDMLQQFTIPEFVGLGSPFENAGSMRNQGWELSLGWKDRIGDVNYYIKGNISDNRNKILKLYGNANKSGNRLLEEGVSLNNYYGYVADGYFQSQEEIDAVDADGKYINAVYNDRKNIKPGYIKYVDLNGDGVINDKDRKIIGDARPHYEYSIQFGLDWKGIDFSAMFHGVGQKQVYYSGGGSRPLAGNATLYTYQLDTWTPENPNAQYPLLMQNAAQNTLFSTFWLKSAAYCRLKNLTIGYTLPHKLTKQAYIERLRFYASAQNLFTIRANDFYKGFDPETTAGASCYPLNKTFLFGVNLEF